MKLEIEASKEEGDKHYKLGNYQIAIENYTKSIDKINNTNNNTNILHILYSNRSACYLKLNNYNNALIDSNKCIALKPNWHKGNSRFDNSHTLIGITIIIPLYLSF